MSVNGGTAAYQGGGIASTHVFHYTVEGTKSGEALSITGFTGTVSDIAGNAGNMAAVSSSLGSVLLDTVRPSVSMTGPAGQASGAFEVTITFSESVSQFSSSDLMVANGSVASLQGSGPSYRASVVPGNGAGEVVVHLNANVALDAAGNGNSAASSLRVVVDHVGPGVSIVRRGASVTGPVNGNFDIAIEFSEALKDPSGSLDSKITLVNGTVVSGAWNSGRYEVVIGPSTSTIASGKEGEVAVSVAAGVAQDSAGNGNEASNILRVFVDKRAPSILGLAVADGYYRTGDAVEIVVEFNEAVLVDGAAPSLALTGLGNASYVGARNGSTHLFSYVVGGSHNDLDGLAASSLANYASFKDIAGNALPDPGSSLTISGAAIVDSTLPTIVDSAGNALADDATVSQVKNWAWKCASEVGCKFRSVVNTNANHSFNAESYTLTDSAHSLTPNPPSNDQKYYLHVQAQDLAGNESQVYRVSAVVDNKGPTATLDGISGTVSTDQTLTVTFDEAVSGFGASNVTITTGSSAVTKGPLTTVTAGTVWTIPINLVANQDGIDVVVTIGAGAATDTVGNGNRAATLHFTVDNVPDMPTGLVLKTPSSSPGNNKRPTLTIEGAPGGLTITLHKNSSCSDTALQTVTTSGTSTANTDIAPASDLGDGSYTFYMKVAKGSFSRCLTTSVAYVLDTVKPTITGLAASSTNSCKEQGLFMELRPNGG